MLLFREPPIIVILSIAEGSYVSIYSAKNISHIYCKAKESKKTLNNTAV